MEKISIKDLEMATRAKEELGIVFMNEQDLNDYGNEMANPEFTLEQKVDLYVLMNDDVKRVIPLTKEKGLFTIKIKKNGMKYLVESTKQYINNVVKHHLGLQRDEWEYVDE